MRPQRSKGAWFSHLLRHPARRWIVSIPSRGTHTRTMTMIKRDNLSCKKPKSVKNLLLPPNLCNAGKTKREVSGQYRATRSDVATFRAPMSTTPSHLTTGLQARWCFLITRQIKACKHAAINQSSSSSSGDSLLREYGCSVCKLFGSSCTDT